jgi:nicotinate phosphoribosyltransferase
LSEGKVTWPGRKQVWRTSDGNGRIASDVLSLENDTLPGETLVAPVMRKGKRITTAPTLAQIRERATRELARLPEPLRQLKSGIEYRVTISDRLTALAAQTDAAARG